MELVIALIAFSIALGLVITKARVAAGAAIFMFTCVTSVAFLYFYWRL